MAAVCAQEDGFGIFYQHGVLLFGRQPAVKRQQEADVIGVLLADGGVQGIEQQCRLLQKLLFAHLDRGLRFGCRLLFGVLHMFPNTVLV